MTQENERVYLKQGEQVVTDGAFLNYAEDGCFYFDGNLPDSNLYCCGHLLYWDEEKRNYYYIPTEEQGGA